MRWSRWLRLFLCGTFAVLIFFAVGLLKNPYGKGAVTAEVAGVEYYLYSPSSQAKIVSELSLRDLPWRTGEKRIFRFQSKDEADRYAMNLLKEKHARIIFEEKAEGVYSIYAHVCGGGNGVILQGQPVNLHLAIVENYVHVGTPMIFGGY